MKSRACLATPRDPVLHAPTQAVPAPAEFERALFHAVERRAPQSLAPPVCTPRTREDAPRASWSPAPPLTEKPVAPRFSGPSSRPPAEPPPCGHPRRESPGPSSSAPSCEPSRPARRAPYPEDDPASCAPPASDDAGAPTPMPPGPSCEPPPTSTPTPTSSPSTPQTEVAAVGAADRPAGAGACRAPGPAGVAHPDGPGPGREAATPGDALPSADRHASAPFGAPATSVGAASARRLRPPVEPPPTPRRSAPASRSSADDAAPAAPPSLALSPAPHAAPQAATPDLAHARGGDAFHALAAASTQEQLQTALHAARAGRDADWQIELSTVLGPQSIRAHAPSPDAPAGMGTVGTLGTASDLAGWTLAMPHPGDPLAWERLRQRTARRGWALEALGGAASSRRDDEGDEPEESA